MSFSDKLNSYLNEYSITASALADKTGLSKSTISRFKNGKQEPAPDSESFKRLIDGLAAVSGKGKAKVYEEFIAVLKAPQDFDKIALKLNSLIEALDINANDLSRYLNYDASYLSRIRSGQRRPASIAEFCEGVAAFTANHYGSYTTTIAMLTDCAADDLESTNAVKSAVLKWLTDDTVQNENTVTHFLVEVDKFDLNEYIRAVHFDDIKTPTIPFTIPGSKKYYGISGFMKAELDWARTTILSPSDAPVMMYSDMPMEDMAQDKDFTKKIIAATAMMLKKGLHLNVIHNIDRSLNEMMIGLESWIPLYMTGQVSPFYFKGKRDTVFNHCTWVSGAAALSGEAINGMYKNGQFYVTRNKDEIAYYHKRGKDMIAKAQALMDIYRSNMSRSFSAFISSDYYGKEHKYRNILSAPPFYTMPNELLDKILTQNNISGKEKEDILAFYSLERERIKGALNACEVKEEVLMQSEAEFEQYPTALSLADIFIEKEIYYTYDTYMEHIEHTKHFADNHQGYKCTVTKGQPFRNIQIRIAEGEYVIISKNTSPTIHFVIRHQKLRQAIEQMILPLNEEK